MINAHQCITTLVGILFGYWYSVKALLLQIARFGVVGGIAFAIDVGVMNILMNQRRRRTIMHMISSRSE